MGNPFTSLGIPEGYSAGHVLTASTSASTYYDPTISYDPLVNPLTGEIDLSAGTWTITSPIYLTFALHTFHNHNYSRLGIYAYHNANLFPHSVFMA